MDKMFVDKILTSSLKQTIHATQQEFRASAKKARIRLGIINVLVMMI